MRRFFRGATTYIFVAPIAIAMSDNGGCSGTDHKAMTADQIKTAIVGKTVENKETHAIAFVDANGSIRAQVSATDAIKTDVGEWMLKKDGWLCVEWDKTIHGKNNCAKMTKGKGNTVLWGGHTFEIKDGNTQKL